MLYSSKSFTHLQQLLYLVRTTVNLELISGAQCSVASLTVGVNRRTQKKPMKLCTARNMSSRST